MTVLTPINEANVEIKAGMTLVEVHARRQKTFNKIVKKATKKFIMTQDGQKYTREGYYIFDDSNKRDLYTRLFVASEENSEPAEETVVPQKTEEYNTNLTLIDETMNIEAGATLYHQCPVRGMRPVKVARTTKTLIILEDGGRYNRKGYATGDTWKRHVLYIEVKESAEETSKVAAPQKTIEERKALVESRKEQRTLAQVAENNAEIAKKLDKLNGFVEQYNATSSQFYKNRIAEQLAWFQSHDISVALGSNGRYVLVEEIEELNNSDRKYIQKH